MSKRKIDACGIYSIINSVNGKQYIGSSKAIYQRKARHFTALRCGSHKNPHLQNAVNRYGLDRFSFLILELFDFVSEEHLQEIEQLYIDRFGSYNIKKSVRGSMSEETKKKISEATKGKKKHPMSDAHRASISRGLMGNTYCVGRKPWNKGIPRTDEDRKKISDIRKQQGQTHWIGKKHSEETMQKMRTAWKIRKGELNGK